eukprot:Hpha_TRINITY_DN16743_c0_g2::TRINITY_DN16743_c0_g2_i11::g.78854::m.78854
MCSTPLASSSRRSQPPAGTTPSRSFVINNQHCYPVLNRDLLLQTIRTKELELQKYTVDIAYDDYDTLVSEEFDPGVEYKKTVLVIDTDDLKSIALCITQHSKH